MKKIILIGNGGHAKVVIDILHLMKGFQIIGVTSKSLKPGSTFRNYSVLGDDNILKDYDREKFIVAMGLGGYRDNNLREGVYKYIKKMGFNFINIIHPSAVISESVKLGESVIIFPGVVLNTDVEIGNNTIIATGSTIDHETIIGNNVLISAGVTIGAYARIQDNSVIALGAKVISGITIGKDSLVAAGAVVIKDVPDNESVFGIPASVRQK
jgi:sugar O-acyltransferase (sialic acid O-acetyltransferase NeuD family)